MAATRLQTIYIYLPIITKYGLNQVATARLVAKLNTYDNNVSIRYISGTKQTISIRSSSDRNVTNDLYQLGENTSISPQ